MRQGPSWSVPEVSVLEQSVPFNEDLGKMSVHVGKAALTAGEQLRTAREKGVYSEEHGSYHVIKCKRGSPIIRW